MFEVDPCLPDPPLRSIPHFPHLHSNRPNQSKLAENTGLFLLKLILTSHGQHNNKNISRVKNCPEITILSSQIGHCSDRGKAPNLCFRCFLGFVLIRRTQRQDRTEAGCDWSCDRALAHQEQHLAGLLSKHQTGPRSRHTQRDWDWEKTISQKGKTTFNLKIFSHNPLGTTQEI